MRSQNATFYGAEPESDGEHIRGVSISRFLAAGLSPQGWTIDAADCWRDAGFVLKIHRATTNMQIITTPYPDADNRWILQIAPSFVPGVLGRMLGRTISASPEELHEVATESKRYLTDAGFYNFRWCWDDFADSEECACDPPAPPR
ncbi:hypothetical protein K227x_32480 [Rubripirellula lacrimiformis]|uniref:Uncharacterized protein n=1 Tax=Rubripirellula lacrimiformis TaxID=1930273 RepID=A0A517NCM6_9BACT|nr:hypothetical protein K227x_32480 [Rubripirellula lacrimiformis]